MAAFASKQPDVKAWVDTFKTLRRCSMRELVCLASFTEFSQRVTIYNSLERTALQPSASNELVPWPVLWLVSCHSKKFVFDSRQPLDVLGLVRRFQVLANKLKWRQLCGSDVLGSLQLWRASGCSRQCTARNPFLEVILSCATEKLVQKLISLRSRCRNSQFSNRTPLAKWAFRIFQWSSWSVLTGDKDGAFSLVQSCELPDLHRSFLDSEKYLPIYGSQIGDLRLGEWHSSVVKPIIKLQCALADDENIAKTKQRWCR